jgi:outer membrane receptor protein involved in Fe transport
MILMELPSHAAPLIEASSSSQVDEVGDLSLDLPSSDPPPASGAPSRESTLFDEIPSVYGAAKYDQKVHEAPAAVIIITAEQIKKYGYRNFAQILDSVPASSLTRIETTNISGFEDSTGPGITPRASCCSSTITALTTPCMTRAALAQRCRSMWT